MNSDDDQDHLSEKIDKLRTYLTKPQHENNDDDNDIQVNDWKQMTPEEIDDNIIGNFLNMQNVPEQQQQQEEEEPQQKQGIVMDYNGPVEGGEQAPHHLAYNDLKAGMEKSQFSDADPTPENIKEIYGVDEEEYGTPPDYVIDPNPLD